MVVGDVSQAFSVRNEPGGANRLAKYEKWMTINGRVPFKCSGWWVSACAPGPALSVINIVRRNGHLHP